MQVWSLGKGLGHSTSQLLSKGASSAKLGATKEAANPNPNPNPAPDPNPIPIPKPNSNPNPIPFPKPDPNPNQGGGGGRCRRLCGGG